jgi:fibrillarin-like rRNA methylase
MLVSILVDIALKNPKIYSVFVSILSKIICDISNKDKEEIIKKILKKFKDKPNSEDMHLWLQRIAINLCQNCLTLYLNSLNLDNYQPNF